MGGSCPKALIQGGIIQGKMFRGWGGVRSPGGNCPEGIS